MSRLTVFAIGMAAGFALGIWFGVNIGEGNDLLTSPVEGTLFSSDS